MKILTVLTYYAPHWTGLTAHAVRVAEGLAARGHQVTVLASRHDPNLPNDEVRNGVRVVRLQPMVRYSRGMFTPAFPWAVAQLIRQHDVVQIHSPLPEAPLVAGLARVLGRPCLMTHHGDLVMPDGLVNRIIERTGFHLLRMCGNLADAVTSYSADYASHSQLLRPLRHKLEFVYPPVELVAPDAAVAQAWKAELGLGGKALFGFAGRWVHEKGFDYLLQALPKVMDRIPNVHLVYAGEPHVVYEDFYERCRPLIEANQDHLTMLGLIEQPQQMANFYNMLDLFVLPSRTDMMALVQIESMLSGTPVVASDIPGARVVVRETGYGQLSPPNDPDGLASSLIEAYQNRPQLRPDRAVVQRIFSPEQSLDNYEAILDKLVRRRTTPVEARVQAEAGIDPRVVQVRDGSSGWQSLTETDHKRLDRLLANEADMAYRRRARVLLDYLELQDGQRVLDGGCGFGFYLMAMGRLRQLRLVGLDDWIDRLRWAQREQVPAGLAAGELGELPFPDRSFDAVLLSEVLEHIPAQSRALGEVRRVLKPGGVLALSVPHAAIPWLWDPFSRLAGIIGANPPRRGPLVGLWTNHERLYWPEALAKVVVDAGFEVEQLEQATHYSFPFIHFLVYGIGKPLFERGLLPRGWRESADRFRGESSGGRFNPIGLGVGLLRTFDRPNNTPRVRKKRTFVNVLLKARRSVS